MEYTHIPVMFKECIDGLNIKKDGIYIDGTLGGAGHSLGILQKLENGKLIAVDKDPIALENAKIKLSEHLEKIIFIHDDYKNLIAHLDELGIEKIDGVLLDLGVSSHQIDTAERGFSYMRDAKLDMRMDTTQRLSAYDIVNTYTEAELAKIIFSYGEERFGHRISSNIVKARTQKKIETTTELASIIERSYPAGNKFKFGHPAKRTFQALRIEVNEELKGLQEFVTNLAMRLAVDGRMCVITFHSLEDRIVKHAFKELEIDCICDKRYPVCICNKRQEVQIITPKPLIATEEELAINKRAESAKLRIIKRI